MIPSGLEHIVYCYHSQVHQWYIGKDTVKSKIEIDPATQMDAGIYECTAGRYLEYLRIQSL